MEEIEISSWATLDAIKKTAEVIETVGSLQTGHYQSVFCVIEDDYLELLYSDKDSNFLRRFEDKDEFEAATEIRKEEEGEVPYDESPGYEEDFEGEEKEGKFNFEDET